MSQEILVAENFSDINILDHSELSATTLVGSDTIVVKNNSDFDVNGFFILDILGKETAELQKIQSVSGMTITIADTIVREHRANELVTLIRYDQIKFYRAANVNGEVPADADFSTIGTANISPDNLETEYIDGNGGSGYWYKFTYYNSISTLETSLADADSMRGGNFGRFVSIFEVRREAGLEENENITDDHIMEKLLVAENEAEQALSIAGYSLPLAEIPETIKQSVRLIAAGHLMMVDYGPEFASTNQDGERKLRMGREALIKISNKQIQIVAGGKEVAVGSGVRGYPLNNTVDTKVTRPRMFTSQQEF